MKKSWFVHSGLTEYQARELVDRYRKSNFLVEKNLSADFLTWEVNVKLPEAPSAPKVDKTFQQKMWRD